MFLKGPNVIKKKKKKMKKKVSVFLMHYVVVCKTGIQFFSVMQ